MMFYGRGLSSPADCNGYKLKLWRILEETWFVGTENGWIKRIYLQEQSIFYPKLFNFSDAVEMEALRSRNC
jgi:hypothetical protein